MIPRVLHQVWVGPPLPERYAAWRARWLELHPAWEHRLWGEAEIDALGLANRALYDDASRLAPGSEGQLRSDVARYEILARHGGVYADLDCEPLRPFDGLLEHDLVATAFAGWEVPGRWVNNAVLAAEPGHPFLLDLVAGLDEWARWRADPGRVRPNVLTGPQYLTPVWRRHAASVAVFPAGYFYPYLWNEIDAVDPGDPAAVAARFPDAWCVHHWGNSRARQRRRPATPPRRPRAARL